MKHAMVATLQLTQQSMPGDFRTVEPFAYRQSFFYDEAGSGRQVAVIRDTVSCRARAEMLDKAGDALAEQGYSNEVVVQCLARCEYREEWRDTSDRPPWDMIH